MEGQGEGRLTVTGEDRGGVSNCSVSLPVKNDIKFPFPPCYSGHRVRQSFKWRHHTPNAPTYKSIARTFEEEGEEETEVSKGWWKVFLLLPFGGRPRVTSSHPWVLATHSVIFLTRYPPPGLCRRWESSPVSGVQGLVSDPLRLPWSRQRGSPHTLISYQGDFDLAFF